MSDNELIVKGELELIEQAEFNGIVCDFYVDESGKMFMTRKQIAKAIDYSDSNAITKLLKRRSDNFKGMTASHNLETPGGVQEVSILNRRGVEEVCRFSTKPKANAFMDFVFDTYNDFQDKGKIDRVERQIEEVAKDKKEEKIMKKINLARQQLELSDKRRESIMYNMQIDSLEQELENHRQTRRLDEIEERVNKIEGQKVPDDYCLGYEIARQLNITSKNDRPHSQLIGAIARSIGLKVDKHPPYKDDFIMITFGDGGRGSETYYSPKAINEIKNFFEKNKHDLKFKIKYKRDSKYGNKGDIRKAGYDIGGRRYITYDATS